MSLCVRRKPVETLRRDVPMPRVFFPLSSLRDLRKHVHVRWRQRRPVVRRPPDGGLDQKRDAVLVHGRERRFSFWALTEPEGTCTAFAWLSFQPPSTRSCSGFATTCWAGAPSGWRLLLRCA